MFSLLPQLLFLEQLAPFAIRVALAILFALAAWRGMALSGPRDRTRSVLDALVAAALAVGLWTQAVAILAALIIAAQLFYASIRMYPRSTLFLALVMALTLVVTGAGAFAFDLPL